MTPTLAEILSTMATQWPWYWPAVGTVLGAVFGSFLNCARYRIPHGMSLRNPPSLCPSCRTRLSVPDLVPIISYLALRGRCRHCGVKIGSTSLWIEIACATTFGLLTWGLQTGLLAAVSG